MDGLTRLIAIEDIKALKARYFRGVDTKDCDLLKEVFAWDATADYRGAATDPSNGLNAVPSNTAEIVVGREAIVDGIMEAVEPLVTVHHGTCPEIEILDSNNASAIWPMVDRLRMPPSAEIAEMVGYGHYYDTYRREVDGWKIARLRLTRLRVDIITRNTL